MAETQKSLRIGAALVAVAYIFAFLGRIPSLLGRTLHGAGGHASGHGSDDSLTLPLVGAALAAVEVLVAWIPVRRGERWAFWPAALPVIILGPAKMANDPGCTTRLFQQHGCHQFMISLLIALTGLAFCAARIFSGREARRGL